MNDPMGLLTPEHVLSGIPERWRRKVTIRLPDDLSMDAMPLIEAMWLSFRRIDPIINLDTLPELSFGIGVSPFRVHSEGVLRMDVALEEGTICAYSGMSIFIDLLRLAKLPEIMWPIGFLEEIVHVVMRVSDEDMAKRIVTILYPEIGYIDGRYSISR